MTAGVTIPNLVVAKVGDGGKVSIYNLNGDTNVVADVVGYYSQESSTGDGYTSLTPSGSWTRARASVGIPRPCTARIRWISPSPGSVACPRAASRLW